jgi:hypothetical protein
MIDRAGSEDRLGAPKQVFDLQQIAVAQHRLQRRDPGVGAQHEDAGKRASSASLPGSISKAGPGLPSALDARRR